MSKQSEWLADLADAADDLGAGIRVITPKSIELFWGNDVTITVETHFLSGRMLRSILKPRPDPAQATNEVAA